MTSSENQINISVIIPTHNRAASLQEVLQALTVQSFSKLFFEVIVVANGCTDNTVERIKKFQAPYKLQILEQRGSGAAAARNSGAAKATGAILLFLDDDIIASPHLIETHYRVHQKADNQVVIGYSPPVLKIQKGFFKKKLQYWWEEIFNVMSIDGYQFSYRSLLSGNLSLPTRLFHLTGGFDPLFQCQEDYELGVRLLKAGAQFVFERSAMGYHNDVTDLTLWLKRKYLEGKASVQFYQKYPYLIDSLPFMKEFVNEVPKYYYRTLHLIYNRELLANGEVVIYQYALRLAEWMHMFRLWEKLLGRLQTYWYLKGMLDSVNDLDTLLNITKGVTHIQKASPQMRE